jgi:hypothetical protein
MLDIEPGIVSDVIYVFPSNALFSIFITEYVLVVTLCPRVIELSIVTAACPADTRTFAHITFAVVADVLLYPTDPSMNG